MGDLTVPGLHQTHQLVAGKAVTVNEMDKLAMTESIPLFAKSSLMQG